MPRHHTYPLDQREAWAAWYTAQPGRTAQDVAEHFGVPVTYVRRHLQVTRTRQQRRGYAVDPYGEAMFAVRSALQQALANDGAMSQYEYDTLCALRDVLANRDPASLG